MSVSSNGSAALLVGLNKLITAGSGEQLEKNVMKAALLLEGRIKGKASGRPGPRVDTGNYRRSWNTQKVTTSLGGAGAIVGTNAPQANRLEFGFTGQDSLGRNYDQPPYPHVEPAIQESMDEIIKLLGGDVEVLTQ